MTVTDPHLLVEPLERLFGSLFSYRLPGGETLLAELDDVQTVEPDGPLRPPDLAAALDKAQAAARAEADGTGVGDVVFALSYDLHWSLRDAYRPGPPPDAVGSGPLAVIGRVATMVRWDPTSGTVSVAGSRADEVRQLLSDLDLTGVLPAPDGLPALTQPLSSLDSHRYERQLEVAREYLERGDVYQVVISAEVRVRPSGSVHAYFAEVSRRYASAAYSYWWSAGGVRFFGNCSLPHVTRIGNEAHTRVFAGTAAAPGDDGELARTHRSLVDDPKYFAEHIMLVDVERNDLGGIAVPDGVRVESLLSPLVIGPTTYLATDVIADIRPDTGLGELLLTTFPRAVVVGAPKIRAQEVLALIEAEARGFYGGAVGLFEGATGRVVSNTIVTCAQVDGDELLLRCGGGVTNESTAPQELSELALKLRYLL